MKNRIAVRAIVGLIIFLVAAGSLLAAGRPEAAVRDVYRIRVGHANAPLDNSALHVTATVFKELVEEYSDGRIEVEIFHSRQMGSDAEMADLTVSGAMEMWVTSLNLMTGYAPRLDAFILPYMFEDYRNFRQARDTLWDEVNDYLTQRANLRMVAMWDSGYRHVMSTRPVRNLDELRRMKFRVPPSPVMIKMVESWGVSPTPVEWGEVFNALQLGVIDAIEVDDSVLISARMNEVIKYITDNDHILQVSVAVMNEDFYQSLPADLKRAVDQAIVDTQPRIQAKSAGILEQARQISKEQHGVQFLGRPDDWERWSELARGAWPEFYERIGEGDKAAGQAFVEKLFQASGM